MAKEQIVMIEWVDAEFHQLEIDARNIKASLPTGSSSISRSTGTLIFADENRLVLSGTKHMGGNETYRDLLVIPQGMVTTVYELQVVGKLFPPEERTSPATSLAQFAREMKPAPAPVPEPDFSPDAEKKLREAVAEQESRKKWGLTLSRKEAARE